MFIFRKRKKLILSLLLIAVVIAGVFGAGQGVFADHGQPPHPPLAQQPAAGNATPQTDLSYWYGAIIVVLEFIRALLAKILAIASYFLGVAFQANISYVPSNDQIAQTGWVVMRDMVNGLFIIITLWISLTIILGIEQYGGKKLLAKVLAVAVLINFSLALVTAVVALSNQFALVFYNKIFPPSGEKDLGALIVQFTQVQSVVNFLTEEERKALANSVTTQPPQLQQECGSTIASNFSSGKCFAAWITLQSAFKATVKAGQSVTANLLGIPEKSRLQALSVGIGVIVFFIITSAFVYAAIALWIRILALMLLAIFAPVAMVAMILPVPKAKEGWDKWQQEFLKWIFFAPVFYFLIYLSLLMANTMNTAIKQASPPGAVSFSDDVRLFLSYTIVIIMLIFAERFAKKSAGKAGEITVGLAKKAAGLAVGVTAGVATGGTLLAARAVARGAAKEGGVAERMAGSRVGRAFGGGALLRKGVQEREAQKQRVEERAKKYEHYSVGQMQAEVKGTGLLYSEENAARIAALAKKKDGFKGMSESELRTAKAIMTRYNRGADIAKLNPTLADDSTLAAKGRQDIKDNAKKNKANNNKAFAEDATRYMAENMDPADVANVNTSEIKKADTDSDTLKAAKQKVREGFARNSRFGMTQITNLALKDIEAAQQQVDEMNKVFSDLNNEVQAEERKGDRGDKELIARGNRRIAQIKEMARSMRYTTGGLALGLTLDADLSQAAETAEQQRRGRGRRTTGGQTGGGGNTTAPTQPTTPTPTSTPPPNNPVNPPTGGGGEVNPLMGI